jgi:hypothetical protein
MRAWAALKGEAKLLRETIESLRRESAAKDARIDLLETTIDRIVAAGNSVKK